MGGEAHRGGFDAGGCWQSRSRPSWRPGSWSRSHDSDRSTALSTSTTSSTTAGVVGSTSLLRSATVSHPAAVSRSAALDARSRGRRPGRGRDRDARGLRRRARRVEHVDRANRIDQQRDRADAARPAQGLPRRRRRGARRRVVPVRWWGRRPASSTPSCATPRTARRRRSDGCRRRRRIRSRRRSTAPRTSSADTRARGGSTRSWRTPRSAAPARRRAPSGRSALSGRRRGARPARHRRGTTPTAHATRAIYAFDPVTATVTKIGDLAVPITHASAVGAGDEVIVAGGQDDVAPTADRDHCDQPDDGSGQERRALSPPRSDAALVSSDGHLMLIGGKSVGATLNTVSELVSETSTGVNVYAHDAANALSPVAATARSLVYVPNSMSNTVDVIDPATYKVIDHFAVGALPQHVTPSWDFTTLYVDNDHGNSLTPDRSANGEATRPRHPGHRPVQPLLHRRRSLRDRRRRSPAATRLSRRARCDS